MYAFTKKGVIYCMDDQMKVLGAVFSSPIWYLGSQDRYSTLGLKYGPKAISEVWNVHFHSRFGLHPTKIIGPKSIFCKDKLVQKMTHHTH